MSNYLRSLRYLEHSITVAAFGTDAGRGAFAEHDEGEDLVEVAMRHAPAELRAEYIRAAEPLSICGVPEVEARAKEILVFASQRR
jgi:hypothetical protein